MNTKALYDAITRSPEETQAFGRGLASLFQPPCLVLLSGELGSGKTTLTKGIAAGLRAAEEDEVTSPSFTLIHEYKGGQNAARLGPGARVYHVDLYRIDRPEELGSLGLDELLDTLSTVLIEWGEKLPDNFSSSFYKIRLDVIGEHERRIIITKNTEI